MSEERNELNRVNGSVIWDDHWNEPAQNENGTKMVVEDGGAWLQEVGCYDACQCGGCCSESKWHKFGEGRLSLKQNTEGTQPTA